MAAWNRWCATVVAEAAGSSPPGRPPHPPGSGVAGAPAGRAVVGRACAWRMIAPAAVDGRPLSHPDHDRLWASFVHHGITPVFHVADQPRLLDEAFYTGPRRSASCPCHRIDLPLGPAGHRGHRPHRQRRARPPPGAELGIVELSSIWVPQYLLMLDGGWEFTSVSTAGAHRSSTCRPSEYFRARCGCRRSPTSSRAGCRPVRGPVHVLQRLPALGGDGTPSRTTHRAGGSPEARPASSTTTWRHCSVGGPGPADQIRCSVAGSARPPKHRSSTFWNTGCAGCRPHEQRHRRAEFLCVDGAEDLVRTAVRPRWRDAGAFDQPRAEDRVVEVGLGLLE